MGGSPGWCCSACGVCEVAVLPVTRARPAAGWSGVRRRWVSRTGRVFSACVAGPLAVVLFAREGAWGWWLAAARVRALRPRCVMSSAAGGVVVLAQFVPVCVWGRVGVRAAGGGVGVVVVVAGVRVVWLVSVWSACGTVAAAFRFGAVLLLPLAGLMWPCGGRRLMVGVAGWGGVRVGSRAGRCRA